MGNAVRGRQRTGSDTGTRLSIADVLYKSGEELGKSEQDLQNILYARKIDEGDADLIDNTLENFSSCQETFDSTCQTFYDDVDRTNSGAFSTNSLAVENREKLQNIQTAMGNVAENIEVLKNKDVKGIINTYNNKLKQLKEGAKRKLLVLAAEKVNEAARNGTSKYVVFSGPEEGKEYPVDKEVFGKDEYVKYSNIRAVTETIYNPYSSDPPKTEQKNKYTATYYVYLKYWGWFQGDFWTLFDWDEEKILKKFNKYNIPIPYDSSSIVD